METADSEPVDRDISSSHRRRETTPSTAWSGRTRARTRSVGITWVSTRARPRSTRSCVARCGPTSWPGLDPPANYSVRLAATEEQHRRGAGFHFLYRGSAPVVRTRDPQRLAAGLCQHLAAFLPATSAGRLVVNGVALVGARGALIAPAALRQWMSAVERRLNVRGLRVVDAPWALIDVDTNEVVVPDPVAAGLGVELDAFRALDDLALSVHADPPVPAGRYPLVGWAFTGDGNPMSRAQGVAFRAAPHAQHDGVAADTRRARAGDARDSPGQRRVGRPRRSSRRGSPRWRRDRPHRRRHRRDVRAAAAGRRVVRRGRQRARRRRAGRAIGVGRALARPHRVDRVERVRRRDAARPARRRPRRRIRRGSATSCAPT